MPLDQAWRSVTNQRTLSNDEPYECDDPVQLPGVARRRMSDGSQWYVFQGEAGTHMPSYAPGSQTCGTLYTGWMSTPHPVPGDPPKEGIVCFDADNADQGYLDCYFSEEVQVCACSYDGDGDGDGGGTITYSYRLPVTLLCAPSPTPTAPRL